MDGLDRLIEDGLGDERDDGFHAFALHLKIFS